MITAVNPNRVPAFGMGPPHPDVAWQIGLESHLNQILGKGQYKLDATNRDPRREINLHLPPRMTFAQLESALKRQGIKAAIQFNHQEQTFQYTKGRTVYVITQ